MPDDAPKAQPQKTRPAARVAAEFVGLSPWKKKLLSLFIVVASIGGLMWTHATFISESNATPPAFMSGDDTRPNADLPPNSRGFIDDTSDGLAEAADEAGVTEGQSDWKLPWHGRLGGWLARLGVSFAVGLIVGVFFRAFLKTMAAVTAVVVGGIVCLSYFEVFDIDFDAMRQNADTASGWAKDQAGGLKNIVVNFLPSATAATVGGFTGFLRR